MSNATRFPSPRAWLRATALAAWLPSVAAAAPAMQDLGAAPSATPLRATIWLKRSDEAGFQAALEARQDPRSPLFRHWMTAAQYARYAPTRASVQTVAAALAQAGLAVGAISADGQRIDVQASAGAMSRAFNTSVHLFRANGNSFAAVTTTPTLAGAASTLVAAITGVSGTTAKPFVQPQIDFATGTPVLLPLVVNESPAAGVSPLNPYLTDDCFDGTNSAQLSTAQGEATFTGQTEVPGLFEPFADGGGVCGYDATQLRAKYGLKAANASGLDGTGQTVAIVDAYGSPFILSDINAYAQIEKLPQLGSRNFSIVAPLGATSTYDEGWSIETTLDVTMVHAIAPKAKIVLLIAPSASTSDLIDTFEYGVEHHLADTFSLSFGEQELGGTAGPASADAVAWAFATAEAASYGIGVTVSSGDSGDNGVGTPYGAANIPADSPYVTAVGGTTLGFPTAEGVRDLGWGLVATEPNASTLVRTRLDVKALGAQGAGGGESAFNEKPYWQSALPGTGRQTPDIAAIADPQTGADLVISENVGTGIYQLVSVVGGTSAASPVLAGMSALANQLAGAPVGQIAPLLGSLPGKAITDILPLSDREPVVTASVDGTRLTTADVTPQALALLPATDQAIAQLFIVHPIFSETILTYGPDTSLAVAKGWDDVTGYGEPTGLPFLRDLAAAEASIQLDNSALVATAAP